MTREDLLSQLRDVQLPPEAGWWPLAPGWWLLLIIVCGVLTVLSMAVRRRIVNRRYQLARVELQRIEGRFNQDNKSPQLAIQLSRWLRRVAILAFPERTVAGKTDQEWLEFLDRVIGNQQFSQGPGHIFAAEVYRADPDIDAEGLINLCEQWLDMLKPRLVNRG